MFEEGDESEPEVVRVRGRGRGRARPRDELKSTEPGKGVGAPSERGALKDRFCVVILFYID